MRVLVCPNTLVIGGASLVAVDLATAMAARGHDVVVLASRGPLVARLEAAGLPWVEAPATDDGTGPAPSTPRPTWPSRAVIDLIRRTAAERGTEVVHTYEWPRCLEAAYGAHRRDGIALVSSIFHVDVPRFLPKTAHYIVGATAAAEPLRARGCRVTLTELPHDPVPDAPEVVASAFRHAHGLDLDVPCAVIASRLAGRKVEGVRHAIAAIGVLGDELPVQLVIAGDGSAADDLQRAGGMVNLRLGRRAIVFTGHLDDVMPAYAAADVVLGMGTSLVSGMALGKPSIVLGGDGFAELVTDETAAGLAAVGYWGTAEADDEVAAGHLAGLLAAVLDDPAWAKELGEIARSEAARRPTAASVADVVESVYVEAIAERPGLVGRNVAVARSASRFAAMRARWWVHRQLHHRSNL